MAGYTALSRSEDILYDFELVSGGRVERETQQHRIYNVKSSCWRSRSELLDIVVGLVFVERCSLGSSAAMDD
jgi:hypothetical protein